MLSGETGSVKVSPSFLPSFLPYFITLHHSFHYSDPGAKFPPARDRYHLYVAYACPWAHRTLIVRALKGLQDTISFTVLHPTWQRTRPNDPNDTHCGWAFAKDKDQHKDEPNQPFFTNTLGFGTFPAVLDGCEPDPFFSATYLRDIYEACGDSTGTRSVPILFDKKTNTIVSNESSEIIRMLNSEFNQFATNPKLDLYPPKHRQEIDEINEWIYHGINNGVYKCGFSKTQEAYNTAIASLTDAFDRATTLLTHRRYLAGDDDDNPTEADVRLFVTLLRFDEVYTVYFKTNTRSVASTPALLNYCRRIYKLPGVKQTCNMQQIKAHYFTSHPILNNYSIIPKGPDFERLLMQEP